MALTSRAICLLAVILLLMVGPPSGAHVRGQVDCSNGFFHNRGGHALSADRLVVNGDVFLDNGLNAYGEVRLVGATINGQLVCHRGRFSNPGAIAIRLDNANLGWKRAGWRGFRSQWRGAGRERPSGWKS